MKTMPGGESAVGGGAGGPGQALRLARSARGALALRPGADIWHKPALSVVITLALPEVALLLAGRLDLAFYVTAGGLCALYAHGQPYAARARTLAWVVLGMLLSTAVALTTAALTDSTAVRVAVAALLAAVHKTVCDATRIGPPANVIFTFVAASAAFLPQRLADIPAHLALGALGGAIAWLVCMAPALVRPHGPERIAVARALEATARLLRANGSRHDTAAAADAARRSLRMAGPGPHLTGLGLLLIRAESAAANPAVHRDRAERFREWAHDLRKGRSLPETGPAHAAEAPEPTGADTGTEARAASGPRAALRAFAPDSPLLPVAARVALGGALAGWASMALGVDRPYWAVVTATAVFAANTTMSWHRGLQRALGNLLGVLLFTALVPLTSTGRAALVAVALACQFATEATIARNYWLGSLFVTPMAMIMVQFMRRRTRPAADHRPLARHLRRRRRSACWSASSSRTAAPAGRVETALAHVDAAVTAPVPSRERLAVTLLELREAADTMRRRVVERGPPAGADRRRRAARAPDPGRADRAVRTGRDNGRRTGRRTGLLAGPGTVMARTIKHSRGAWEREGIDAWRTRHTPQARQAPRAPRTPSRPCCANGSRGTPAWTSPRWPSSDGSTAAPPCSSRSRTPRWAARA